jgi:hypothetical protein
MTDARLLIVNDDAYHADLVDDEPTLSRSVAHLLCTSSPAHARAAHPRLADKPARKDSDAMDFGTQVHDLLLRGTDRAVVVDANDWRTKAAKEQRDQARDLGHVPLLSKDWERAQQLVDAAREQFADHDAHPPLLEDGAAEQTIVWRDQGVLCRCKLDWLRTDREAVDDLKTVGRTAEPAEFGRSLFGNGYDLQAAMYSRAVLALTGRRPDFRFIAIETSPPFQLSVVMLAPDALALADRKLDFALDVWRRCLAAGEWPGYPNRVAHVEAPPWAESQWFDKEARAAA